MPKFIAFLRAINVGGHRVKMDYLRQLFESLGFADVGTFIASGNVVFTTTAQNAKVLEKKIEEHLHAALGYEVVTFIRTADELAYIANYQPFGAAPLAVGASCNIGFLKDGLDEKSEQKLLSLRTESDDFHVHGREVYWLCRQRLSDSTFSLEKILKLRATFRGANTVKRMAAKYS